MNSQHAALIALLRTRPKKLTWQKLTQEVMQVGSASVVWGTYNPDELISFEDGNSTLAAAEADLADWNRRGLKFVSVLDPEFPCQLRGVGPTPPFLFIEGKVLSEDPAIAIVGSRKASPQGIHIASEIAKYLASEGLAVVSGLADGIDAAAHSAALAAGGRTVAVIATGVNKSYPAANRELQAAIGRDGLLLSQFWPDAPPEKANFLRRNAVISAYSLAAVVVEAGENSGARNLARHALEQGRPLILTDLVVEQNQWAREFAERPDVHVVASLSKMRLIVDEIRARPTESGPAGNRGLK